jgi:hypothetical protein
MPGAHTLLGAELPALAQPGVERLQQLSVEFGGLHRAEDWIDVLAVQSDVAFAGAVLVILDLEPLLD